MAALAGPTAEEKLLQRARHAKFGLTQIATRAIDGVQINRNGRFVAFRHSLYLGWLRAVVKVRDAAVRQCSSWYAIGR